MDDSSAVTDASIVDAARAGAEWAWDRIYRNLAPEVRGFLMARGAKDPDGLLGEVFLQTARGIGDFEGGERDLRAWVFTIARRRLIDERRWWKRRDHGSLDEVGDLASSSDVEDEGTAATRQAELLAVLDVLTPDQREVMLLRILGGLKLTEIAEVVGKRVNAVKRLQHRAAARLREAIERGDVTL